MARIRTIKPEFWTDEDLSEVSEAACLLAIGLLNYADDEGYFNANPKLVKAAVFPIREQSGSIPVLLQELSSVGYISLFSGADGKIYGLVNNFLKHQVINKAKKSAIKELCTIPYEYGSNTVQLPPGMERNGKEQGKENPHIAREEFSAVDNFQGKNTSSEPDPGAGNFVMDGYVPPGGSGHMGKFAISPDWKPDPDFRKQAAIWGIQLTKEVTPQELASFIDFWQAEGKAFHHTQWQQKLARSVQQSRARVNGRTGRDVNAIPEPEDEIPPGFRG
ncbi:primosomal protein [Cronobacter sakazakii]|nr:DnaT-like ssDNA-binding domain-containing protein [Cronobacter sakazakii]PQZ45624.1 primosomal protein [Cronobacter sakazakii]